MSRPLTPFAGSTTRRVWLTLTVAGALSTPAMAQDTPYPDKPVRLVVSYAAGNVTDLLARIVADKLGKTWGQPVTVDNKPGQGGSLGAQLASRAPADGYTLLFSALAAMAVNPHLYANVGYDARKDFVPIINVASSTGVLVVSPALKVHNFAELLAYSKANPQALSYGTAGNGTVPHLNMEAIKAATGLSAQHVPYKAAGAVLTDVLGGRIQIQSDALSVFLPHIKAGKLVPIMATSRQRLKELPDVPTLSELMPSTTPVTPWLGIFAPAGTPAAITAKVQRDVTAILAMPDVQAKFAEAGLLVSGDGGAVFAKTIADDYARLGTLVRQLHLKVD